MAEQPKDSGEVCKTPCHTYNHMETNPINVFVLIMDLTCQSTEIRSTMYREGQAGQ